MLKGTAGLTALVLAWLAVTAGAQGDYNDWEKVNEVSEKSVALLTGRSKGYVDFKATGFVVERNNRKYIITCAHQFRNLSAVAARLPEYPGDRPCNVVQIDAERDLAVLAPAFKVAARGLAWDADPRPKTTQPVCMIGCPRGTPHWSFSPGVVRGKPLLWRELVEGLGPDARDDFGVRMDLKHIPHDCNSHAGMSGAPILNTDGRVIGVNRGTLPGGPGFGFGISSQHIGELDFDRKPQKTAAPVLRQDVAQLLDPHGFTPGGPDARAIIDLAFKRVDMDLYHYGLIEKDASTVIQRYFTNRQDFISQFTQARIAELLKSTEVADVVNPAVGYRVLVPKGYKPAVSANPIPVGVKVALRNPRRSREPYHVLTIYSYSDPGIFRLARDVNPNLVAEGEFAYRFGYRYKTARTDTVAGMPTSPMMTERRANLKTDGWVWANYESQTAGHSVHFIVRSPNVLGVHYQYDKNDIESYKKGERISVDLRDFLFISASVSQFK